MLSTFTPHGGFATAVARLNIRIGQPSTKAPIAATADVGRVLEIVGIGSGEPTRGNATWFAGNDDTYFWSGGCAAFAPAPTAASPAASIQVNRRPDGTILPLSDKLIRQVFGTFAYSEGAGGRISIDQAWVSANIGTLATPVLTPHGFPTLQFHNKAQTALAAVLAAIDTAGLSSLILTCGGSFVPRHKGWDPNRGLSSHSWGVAVDFNAAWNGFGSTPAPVGSRGSLRQLVPFFEAQGFAWGGYFSPPFQDGMHFELARLDL